MVAKATQAWGLMVVLLVACGWASAQQDLPKLYRSTDAGKLEVFLRQHGNEVFLVGGQHLHRSFENTMLDLAKLHGKRIRVLTGQNNLATFARLRAAGADVRAMAGTLKNSMMVLEERYFVAAESERSRRYMKVPQDAQRGWMVVESAMVAKQVLGNFQLAWTQAKP